MTPTTLHKTLPWDTGALIELAPEVERFLAQGGTSAQVAFKVQLALEEVIRNLVEHGVGPLSRSIDVRLDLEGPRVRIQIEDDSQPFDPAAAPAFDPSRPVEERSNGGMGVHLVRSFMDEVRYERLLSRNRLTLVASGDPPQL